MLNQKLPVLIVGAGPTGLMMACELARHGLPFRIIDKKPERTLTANAVGIQTRSLEIFDNLGLIQKFLKMGHPCKGVQLHVNGKELVHLSFEKLDSYYRFIMTLPQSETERLLLEHLAELKQEVERPCELLNLEQQDQQILCTLKNPQGEEETLACQWLIACDGAKSSVRSLAKIDFPGEDLSEQFMVANAEMSTFLSTSEIHAFFNKGALLIAVPFGSHNYRIGVNLHQSAPRQFLVEKEVKELVQERSQGAYDVNSVSWISPFWIHGKLVKALRVGSIFLAGDAAHIHSPAGAQGMNTGLQDAYNLAWKLALVVKGKARPSLLDSYHEERYPIVQQIVARAEGFTKLALLENPFLIYLRNLLLKLLNTLAHSSKKVAMRFTQLSFRYTKSSAISYTRKLSRKAPGPGERAPDVLLNAQTRLYDYLREPLHHVLLFTDPRPQTAQLTQLQTVQEELEKAYPGLVKAYIIVRQTPLAKFNNLLLDEKGLLHQRYGATKPALYVIRPDLYLAGCSSTLSTSAALQILGRYLT